MAQPHASYEGLLSASTAEFDRALHLLQGNVPADPAGLPAFLGELADRLRGQPGMPRREFDRRLRLIVTSIVGEDVPSLRSLADHFRRSSPDALNVLRTLLPVELRHLATPARPDLPRTDTAPAPAAPAAEPSGETTPSPRQPPQPGRYNAVALIGTPDEHAWNEFLLGETELDPMCLPSLEQLWDLASTGLCGLVVGGSVWADVPAAEQRRTIHRICEYSTFLLVRVCVNGLAPEIEQNFAADATDARCGPLDGNRLCHGRTCELTRADVGVLQSRAVLLSAAAAAGFYPLGLKESEASLLRLIASDRHHSARPPLTMGMLGVRELHGGRSGARVFLLNDGSAQPFVAKIDASERLRPELQRYHRWIEDWEPNVTNPTFHAHRGSAAISYRLQPAADATGIPAPTLEEGLEKLRSSEWTRPPETSSALAHDLFIAITRSIERLGALNSRKSGGSEPDEFWLDWPVSNLAARGIEITLVDRDWQSITLAELIEKAMSCLRPHLAPAVVHGDVHGRNILLLDRTPAFIDFAWSGPGHPLVDLVRLDAEVRRVAMRMSVDKQSLFDTFNEMYVEGAGADRILREHPEIAASPLAALAVKTTVSVREVALEVAKAHSLGLRDYLAMTCVVAGNVLVDRNPGSGIERLVLSVAGSRLLEDMGA